MTEPDIEALAEAALGVANFAAAGVIEADGKLYLPTKIRVRKADGTAGTAEDVLLTAPTHQQRVAARVQAREWAVKVKLDLDRDKPEVDELENYWLLTYAIRDRQTRSQLEESAVSLTRRFSDFSLKEVWARLNHWGDLMDPRYGDLSNEQLWQLIAEVAGKGTLLPLVATPGYAQATCIIFMARAACSSPSAPTWLSSPTKSRSAPSTETPSEKSSAGPSVTGEAPGEVSPDPG